MRDRSFLLVWMLQKIVLVALLAGFGYLILEFFQLTPEPAKNLVTWIHENSLMLMWLFAITLTILLFSYMIRRGDR